MEMTSDARPHDGVHSLVLVTQLVLYLLKYLILLMDPFHKICNFRLRVRVCFC
jgi:hypothetical protein